MVRFNKHSNGAWTYVIYNAPHIEGNIREQDLADLLAQYNATSDLNTDYIDFETEEDMLMFSLKYG